MNKIILLSIILLTTGCANNYVPNFTYKRDWNPETGKYTGVWKSCARTRAEGGGDCEDWAVCAAHTMMGLGVPAESITFQVWNRNTNDQIKEGDMKWAHAALKVDFPDRGIEYWSNHGYHGKKGLMGYTLSYERTVAQVAKLIERDKSKLTRLADNGGE